MVARLCWVLFVVRCCWFGCYMLRVLLVCVVLFGVLVELFCFDVLLVLCLPGSLGWFADTCVFGGVFALILGSIGFGMGCWVGCLLDTGFML